jgi:multidrug efflux pump subunit AcrA (membrane-fusion protein)
MRTIYRNAGLNTVLTDLNISSTSSLDDSNLFKVLYHEAWYNLISIFVPPAYTNKAFVFPQSKVVRRAESPAEMARQQQQIAAALAAKVEAEKKAQEEVARQQSIIAEAKAEEVRLEKERQSNQKAADAAALRKARAEKDEADLREKQKAIDEEIIQQQLKIEQLRNPPTPPPPATNPTPRASATPQRNLSPHIETDPSPTMRETFHIPDDDEMPTEPTLNALEAFRKHAIDDFSIPANDVEAMVEKLRQDMARHLDTNATYTFMNMLTKIIGSPINLAQICSPHSTNALLSVENDGRGGKEVRLVQGGDPARPAVHAQARAHAAAESSSANQPHENLNRAYIQVPGVKRTAEAAQHTPERRGPPKKGKTVQPLKPMKFGDLINPGIYSPSAGEESHGSSSPIPESSSPIARKRASRATPEYIRSSSPTPIPRGQRKVNKGKGKMRTTGRQDAHGDLEGMVITEDDMVDTEDEDGPDDNQSSPIL